MGHVKRQTYNNELMTAVDYSTVTGIKNVIRRLLSFEGLAERGDTVAASVLVDIKKAIGTYGGSLLEILTPKQRYVIVEVLVNDKAQADVANDLDISQQGVSYLLGDGIKRIMKYLNTGKIPWRRVTDEEKAFILENYGKMPLYKIARQLQRSEQNCREIFKNLQKEGDGDGEERSGKDFRGGG
jgi:predicted DNA-binding protein YlxM (UPF0122 family)